MPGRASSGPLAAYKNILIYIGEAYYLVNTFLASLAKACQDYRFKPKLLIVESYQQGHQLLTALAGEGVSWLNLVPVTPLDLAQEIWDRDPRAGDFQGIGPGQALFLVSEILDKMYSQSLLEYFSKLQGTDSLVDLLYGTLQELRMAGISSDQVKIESFVDEKKGRELKILLEEYEKTLEEEKLLDSAALYSRALDMLKKDKGSGRDNLYLLPEELDLDYLSFTFLDRLTREGRLVLPGEKVEGLSRTHDFYFKASPIPQGKSPFSWLFQLEGAPSFTGEKPEVFQAYGASCEVKEVFRRLKKDHIPVDQGVICYTRGEDYIPLLLALSSTLDIPLTFAGGLPVAFTRPGKLLLGLLYWIEDNYSLSTLYSLFAEGNLKVSTGTGLARLLRQAGIGWGRNRYLPSLEALKESFQERARRKEEEEGEGLKDYRDRKQEQVQELYQVLSFILDNIPHGKEDKTPFQELCRGLSRILEEYAPSGDSWEVAAQETLREHLEEIALSIGGEIPLGRAVKRLRETLGNLSAGASSPEPGHLHVASLRQGEWAYRPYTFVVGLDDGHFPGSGLQDPVLLEVERAFLSPHLKGRASLPQENIYQLNRLLATRKGKMTLSFPSYDPVEGRASFPTPLLLQVYRLVNNNPRADYSTFIKSLDRPAAYFPREENFSFSPEEWWGSQVLEEKRRGDLPRVRECYPGIDKGLLAEEYRQKEIFTIFDGKIQAATAPVDPRKNQRPLSATALEQLAACPYSYFLRFVLKIEPPEEEVFDPGTWLDPLSRGLLMHQIYAEYLRKISSNKPSPSQVPEADGDLLVEIAREFTEKTREEIPPPSLLVYEEEKMEILQGLEVFLRSEELLRQEGSIPLYLEVPFGLKGGPQDIKEAGLGREKPLEIKLPRGDKVALRGRIDRIDLVVPRETYRVLDFKTGGTYNYDEGKYLLEGRQIQHALYGLAAEVILQEKYPQARVEDAGYIFPTEKGEGQCFLHLQDRRQEALEALEKMIDLLSAGAFCPTDDQKRCNYCDYQAVCRYPSSVEGTKTKLSCQENLELQPWKELKEYE
ncbi:MAG: PD-(D/E)XK nuclease family protein [Candidatus Syntrophonatronum acetioxidans]|uniref:PD-(D/E)XK nuclease family protein n=1 Tax=Candidatus Syntrophonatronum acetioxidans TaxID=1795816 RepID=A0A424YBH7_9FIRM|nr:MAG: PD-(D/E)XK nuclease family protein [Candidatus Syntrophonatronum acetioxidans]